MARNSDQVDSRRLFIAAMLPADVRESLAAQLSLLDDQRHLLRPVRPQGLHCTLHFLGTMSNQQEQQISRACHEAASKSKRFSLTFGGLGAFPSAQNPRVIWIGVLDGSDPLHNLRHEIQNALTREGIATPTEEFVPHITLARRRASVTSVQAATLGAQVASLPTDALCSCSVSAVSLVESTTTEAGSAYLTRDEWPLL